LKTTAVSTNKGSFQFCLYDRVTAVIIMLLIARLKPFISILLLTSIVQLQRDRATRCHLKSCHLLHGCTKNPIWQACNVSLELPLFTSC